MDFGNVIGKESIYLNIVINNLLEGVCFNYSCTPLNTLGGCRQDYVIPEVHTGNSMPNIPSCSTLITLEIKNVESNSVGVKSLSGSCDIQVEDKTRYRFYISVDKYFKYNQWYWRSGYFIWKHVSIKIQNYFNSCSSNGSCVNCSSYSCYFLILLL
jgi:hypothetical protein